MRLIDVDPSTASRAELDGALERFWFDNPFAMDQARREGPQHIFAQERMVTVADCSARVDDHPLVVRANARSAWTGAWEALSIAVILPDTAWRLDDSLDTIPRPPAGDFDAIDAFDRRIAGLKPEFDPSTPCTGWRFRTGARRRPSAASSPGSSTLIA